MPLNIVRTNLLTMDCDAIVNSTNAKMHGYSGLDKSIHSAAGAMLEAECKRLRPLELGFAKITEGYSLPCRYIIHTCSPKWMGGALGELAILKSCYLESLKLAKAHKLESLAFPLISSGNYGFPKNLVMKLAVEAISEFLQDNDMTVYLCVHDKSSYSFDPELYGSIRSYVESFAKPLCSPKASKPPILSSRFGRPKPDKPKDSASDEPIELFSSDSMPFPSYYALGESLECPSSPLEYEPLETAPSIASLDSYLRSSKTDGFSDTLMKMIDKQGIGDVECYKKANVDKKLFSKIKCNRSYKPSKQTAIAFAIALKLDLEETKTLLASAGLALSHSSVFDIIIEYHILNNKFDIFEINEALFEFDQPLLGC